MVRDVTNCDDIIVGGSAVLGPSATCVVNSPRCIYIQNPTIPVGETLVVVAAAVLLLLSLLVLLLCLFCFLLCLFVSLFVVVVVVW